MDSLKEFFDNLKERIKTLIQEQQESELFISLKERYHALTPTMQKVVKWSAISFAAMMILWMPVFSFLDSVSRNGEFEDRRQSLKDLLKIERDYATITIATPANPFAMKGLMDQKLMAFGVKPEQIKDTTETSEPVVGSKNVEQKGIQYQLLHLTIRQAIDVSCELEQMDKNLKLQDFELTAEPADPHYYNLRLKLITFVPKAPVSKPDGAKSDKVANAK